MSNSLGLTKAALQAITNKAIEDNAPEKGKPAWDRFLAEDVPYQVHAAATSGASNERVFYNSTTIGPEFHYNSNRTIPNDVLPEFESLFPDLTVVAGTDQTDGDYMDIDWS